MSTWSVRRGWLVPLALIGLALGACSGDTAGPTEPGSLARGGAPGPDLRAAIAAKDAHTSELMQNQDVVGLAVGLNASGQAAVKVYLAHGAAAVPSSLDGVPVDAEITGPFRILPLKDARPSKRPGGGGGGGGGSTLSPTSLWPRPVPIGVSTGNAKECAAGTIGARVLKGGNAYALSNNHVYARQNAASIGEEVLQPGRYDTQCATVANSHLGTLADFHTISFSGNNTVDVAIAKVNTGDLGNSTPPDGYGTPSSTTTSAALQMRVEKYGRTTGLTRGVVAGVNATINVQYDGGVATFVNQIVISGSKGPFSRAGDSGSLIVTDNASHNPVGLLFAGSSTSTIANPIDAALSAVGVTIDGN